MFKNAASLLKHKATLAFTVGSLMLVGCSESQEKVPPKPAAAKSAKPAAPKKEAFSVKDGILTTNPGDSVAFEITSNDAMQYNLKEIHVQKGQKITLTLSHVGKMAKTVMGHNWVLLKKDVDVSAFATAAMSAQATAYIPADKKAEVLAHTDLIGGGEKSKITFEAPEPGEYIFLCTFPGHNAMMRGKFIVK